MRWMGMGAKRMFFHSFGIFGIARYMFFTPTHLLCGQPHCSQHNHCPLWRQLERVGAELDRGWFVFIWCVSKFKAALFCLLGVAKKKKKKKFVGGSHRACLTQIARR
ncbi:hypothetical protein BDZ45DRAFT_226160 [Acephala macrosclerotiorum]|nr:hypothetical protein BDZ45DRAFT_226160 [Acephala macrosclerotiorum]